MGRDRVGTVGTMVGDKGNGLSIKGSRSKNTVRLLGPHAAAKTPLKKSEKGTKYQRIRASLRLVMTKEKYVWGGP